MLSFYIPSTAWLGWCGLTSYFMIRDVRGRMRAADGLATSGRLVSA